MRRDQQDAFELTVEYVRNKGENENTFKGNSRITQGASLLGKASSPALPYKVL